MISFHLPPNAACAAVKGHPSTGFGRCSSLPLGAFSPLSCTATYYVIVTEAVPTASPAPNPVVEVRTYRTKPGRRAEFVELFQTRAGPAQLDYGMTVLGPLLDTEDPDVLIWLRAFPSAEQREPIKDAFYEGRLWKEELEHLALPLLADYSSIVCEMPRAFLDGPLRAQQWRDTHRRH
jgi:hypothetical protein